MVTAARMVHIGTARAILRSTRADAAAYILTAIITISFDLIVAVVIGVVFAGIFALRGLSRASTVHREGMIDVTDAGQILPGDERIAIIRFDGPLFFAAADRVSEQLRDMEGATVVILRMSQLELVDATGARMLGDIVQILERRGITVLIKGVQPRHEDLFRTVGVLGSLRHHKHLFTELPAAIAHARSHIARDLPDSPRDSA